jgi:hypothetical protein
MSRAQQRHTSKKDDSFACTLKARPTQLFVHDQQKRLLAGAKLLAFLPSRVITFRSPSIIILT